MADHAAAGAVCDRLAQVILDADIRRKAYAGRIIVEELALRIRQGEIVALVGPSGCGKTTLLRMIGGLDTAFDGTLHFAQPRPRIGVVFQEPRLLPWRTVAENLALVQPYGSAIIDRLLRDLDLEELRHAYPATLSGGQARRVAVARALAIEPALLLLDEPFASLDPAAAEQGRSVLLAAWRRHPLSVLLVTHDLAEAAALADRVLLLTPSPMRVRDVRIVPEDVRRSGISVGARLAAEIAATSASPDRR